MFAESGTETYPAVIRSGMPEGACDLTVFGGYQNDGKTRKRVMVREVENVPFLRGEKELYPHWEYARL
jgi:hypothetical protein